MTETCCEVAHDFTAIREETADNEQRCYMYCSLCGMYIVSLLDRMPVPEVFHAADTEAHDDHAY